MSNKDVLERAISKAIDGGYTPDGIQDYTSFRVTIRNGQAWVRWFNNSGQEVIQDIEHVIYDQEFAEAIWGKKWVRHSFDITPQIPFHQYNLREMVIADDPIKYLGANI